MTRSLLNADQTSYSSTLGKESLRNRIEDLFEQNTVSMGGKLTSDSEFTAYDQLIVIGWNVPNLRRKAAYLTGKISDAEKGTLIKLQTQPNSVFPIFSILSTLLGAVITIWALANPADDKFLLILGLVFVALGIIYYPISTLLKNRLRNKFVTNLELEKIVTGKWKS